MRWTEDKLIQFSLCFVSLHCADAKVRNRASKLLAKLRSKDK